MSAYKHAIAKYQEGVALLKAGELDPAVRAFTDAVSLDPRITGAYRNRAQAYRRLGKAAETEADQVKADSLAHSQAEYIGAAREREERERARRRQGDFKNGVKGVGLGLVLGALGFGLAFVWVSNCVFTECGPWLLIIAVVLFFKAGWSRWRE